MTTEAETVAQLVRESAHKPHIVKVRHGDTEAEVLLTPDADGSWRYETAKYTLRDYEKAPERRKGTAQFTDLESFIKHTTRFRDDDSLVFMDRNGPKLVSVLDYHRAGHSGAPRYGEHRGVYLFPVSDQWTAWISANGRQMAQDVFARFIEDRILDIANPADAGESVKPFLESLGCGFASAAKLLELSRGLEVHVGQRVKQAVRLSSGEVSIAFEEEHTDKGGSPLKIPQAFLLGIPVFRNGDLYQIAARLRYRVNNGQVSWSYEMHRHLDVYDHALNETCQDVAENTGLDVLEGTPEV